VAIDPETLDDRDEPTARLLASGETIGVNQLESPAMRRLLRQLRPACMKDLMKTLALIRPGAASLGMKEAFIRRSRAEEAVPPIDRRVDGILRETHGIMLYEDDALLVAVALANLPPGEADRFRRAVTKCRSDRERADLSRAFLGHCRRNGVDPRISADLWSQMAKFNSYSFCRAHAASYARIAWANAYVKSHYPLEFWVGVLNNNQGLYDKWVYVEAAKREGVRILPPCVNRSGEEFTLDGGAIRVGLGRIRELTAAGKESIRRNRPFRHLTDMVLRTCLRRGDIANLIRTGALDFMGKPRARLLRELDLLFGAASRLRGHPLLFEIPEPFVNDNNCPADSEIQRWQDEWAVMGLSSGKHPVAYMRPGLKQKGIVSSRWIGERIGREIRLCGMPATARTTTAGKGEKMCFITLCDEDGMFEVTLFPDVFSRYRQTLVENQSGLFWVAGKAESQYDAISVTAEEIGSVGQGVG
jgi:DNA polymerase III alpha subunit